jgi:RNA polymerase sigma-70 factor (ECF subfamily)
MPGVSGYATRDTVMRLFRADKSHAQREFEAEALVHLDALHAHALRLTRSPADADDLVQETFVKALRFYDRFERGSNLKAWLLRIQFNAFVNKYRRRVKEYQVAESMSQEPAGDATVGASALRAMLDPEGGALRSLVANEISAALSSLPEEHRTVVLLADVEELSYKEIADVIGCPIGTVMSRLHRARKTLQQRLSEHAAGLGLSARPASKTAEENNSVHSEADEEQGGLARASGTDGKTVSLASYRRERSKG